MRNGTLSVHRIAALKCTAESRIHNLSIASPKRNLHQFAKDKPCRLWEMLAYYFAPGMGVKYCDKYVSRGYLSACMSRQ